MVTTVLKTCLLSAVALFACKSNHADDEKKGIIQPPKTETKSDVDFWLTNTDQSSLFKKQNVSLLFGPAANTGSTIEIDDSKQFQEIDGFGYTLTGGSATLINSLNESSKAALLKELFQHDGNNIGVSYLRISLGASDLSESVFTYNDLPVGEIDLELKKFTLEKEKKDLIPVLKQIISIFPQIKIMASPWTPPLWMKTNNNSVGGSLRPEYYDVYARYLAKYIQEMAKEGIIIDALTVQNEPLHPGNNPSLLMLAADQKNFVKNNLGPVFKAENIKTKIVVYDHNADKPEYPIEILNDPDAKKYVDGSAFHLYAGSISALSTVHNAHPDKNIYFTEQWVGAPSNFSGDFKWHVENVIIGSMNNWSKVALEWNLAADALQKPHTQGGCTQCLGALTIDGPSISRNVAYYIIAHASKFVRPGSKRIFSSAATNLQNVAFKTPEGKIALIVLNKSGATQSFNVKYNGKQVSSTLNAGSVGTYVW
ncbi:Glucan endo-1,6-beta-glucosidase [Pseudopedobacter saltans DSM 12145]|uniref:Glucan endo-1,6-beta-glucosidase n=1 Tax=Pseudopedobacter saltans (strain ATCC 51119 / DSM 12145 / JCM 21818 / CCUG 39354 / LMG 10337 / NBRC 100064 / NCIMB 13643) TaxID=762903 RepID=F0SA51_PSESL|nr:glycoside hydrolase family 30 beta sandwich domain-containing protein [Pseudopedobacter saltans]ADY53615.1 Glucan endo-1,6-beta-glucosidase [Pseudopedobacter saltans DSM 12145]